MFAGGTTGKTAGLAELKALKALEAEVAKVLGALDPDAVALCDAPAAYESVARMDRLVAGAKLRLARRAAESREWARRGYRNPAEYLGARSGASEAAARAELQTSKGLAALGGTDEAVRRGELSATQAALVAAGASADPASERKLLARAASGSVKDLRTEAAYARARADGDPDATQRRHHRDRFLRTWSDLEGAFNLSGKGSLADGATINALLDPVVEELFHQARREGRRESRDAYAFDALVELLRRGAGLAPARPGSRATPRPPAPAGTDRAPGGDAPPTDGPPPEGAAAAPPADGAAPAAGGATAGADGSPAEPSPAEATPPASPEPTRVRPTHLALLRVDWEALVRGAVEGEERCDISGLGPVPVSTARALLGESVVKLVITKGVGVANVTHLGRGPTVAQRVALLWSSPDCTDPFCTRPGTEIDHRVPFAEDPRTDVANLDPACGFHHYLKTHQGWAFVEGVGRRPMVPPDDPRHPANGANRPHAPPADPPPADPPGEPPTLFGCGDAA